MKKQKCTEKKMSLNKLQMVKINKNLISIRGGVVATSINAYANNDNDNDTVLDNTYTNPKGQNGGIQN